MGDFWYQLKYNGNIPWWNLIAKYRVRKYLRYLESSTAVSNSIEDIITTLVEDDVSYIDDEYVWADIIMGTRREMDRCKEIASSAMERVGRKITRVETEILKNGRMKITYYG